MSGIATYRYLLARRATALGVLALFWLGAHTGVAVLTGNLSSSRLLDTVPLSDPWAVAQILATGQSVGTTALIGAAVVLAFYVLVGGRAFCGWVCPIGISSDTARWLRNRLGLRGQFRVARSVRYWILALALPVSALTGVAAFEWLSPIGMVVRAVIFGTGLGLLALAVLFLVDLFLIREGWCGALCPLGAFYSLVGRVSPLRMGFAAERCDRCGDCVPVCPEPHVIHFDRMTERGFVDSGDCLNCARCLEVCSRHAYQFTLRLPSMRRPHKTPHIREGESHAIQAAG